MERGYDGGAEITVRRLIQGRDDVLPLAWLQT